MSMSSDVCVRVCATPCRGVCVCARVCVCVRACVWGALGFGFGLASAVSFGAPDPYLVEVKFHDGDTFKLSVEEVNKALSIAKKESFASLIRKHTGADVKKKE